MTMKKDKVLNVRIPEGLYERVKDKSPRNFSKLLREHFEEIVEKDDKLEKEFNLCVLCHKYNEECFITQSIHFEEVKEHDQFIVCQSCKERIENNSFDSLDKDMKDFVEILKILLDNKCLPSQEFKKVYIQLIKHFPEKWSIKKGILSVKKVDKEEIKEQFYHINSKEGDKS